MPRRPLHLIWAAALVAVSGTARSVWSQEGASAPAEAQESTHSSDKLRFAFKDATVDQVIEFFGRETGLPVIREANLPGGTITFVSEDEYPLDEALRVLNTILQTRGVMLRRDAKFLYLQKLENMKAEPVPTFTGPGVPAGVTDDQIISIVIRLRNAQAKPITEQLAPLVASYGAIVAMPQQNSVVLTETAAQCRRLTGIIEAIDARPAFEETVRLFPLKHVRARDALNSLRVLVAEKKTTVVLDADGKRRTLAEDDLAGLRIEADQRTNSIIAVGSESRLATIDSLVKLLDVDASETDGERTVRVITLKNADANSVSAAASRMFEQDANRAEPRPAIAVDSGSNSLVIRGSASQHTIIENLAAQLDGATAASSRELRTIAIDRSRADAQQIAETVRRLLESESGVRVRVISADDLLKRQTKQSEPAPKSDEPKTPEAKPDTKPSQSEEPSVAPPAPNSDEARGPILLPPRIKLIIDYTQVLLAMAPQDAASDDGEVTIAVDPETNALIIVGPKRAAARAAELADRVQRELPAQPSKVTVVELPEGVQAWAVSSAIQQSLWAIGGVSKDNPGGLTGRWSVVADPMGRSLVITANDTDFTLISEMVTALTRPGVAEMPVRTIKLERADANAVANAVARFFDERAWLGGSHRKVAVLGDRRSSTLIIAAKDEDFDQVQKIVETFDAPAAVSDTQYRVIELKHAPATDIASTLRSLWRRRGVVPGEPEPALTASARDNTLIVAATKDQLADLERILKEVDVPAKTKRRTEFVPLEHANAEQAREALSMFYGRFAPEAGSPAAKNVTIVADAAGNSLVISAEEGEWAGIHELITKLDDEKYDASRQLEVIALKHADARSVATALQSAFEAPLRAQLERQRARDEARRRGERDPFFNEPPSLLVPGDEIVSVSAEPLTNSLVITAGRRNLDRIKALIARLDVPEFANLPDPRVLPLKTGKASELANSLRQMYEQSFDGRPAGRRGLRSVAIVADDASNALIVRADDEEFAQIKALADAIQQEGMLARVQVRVLQLHRQSSVRLATTIQRTFAAGAQQNKEPLAVEAERKSNSLVIASSKRIYDEIEKVVRELDGEVPQDGEQGPESALGRPGQGLFIIDVNNTSPDEVRRMLELMGVTRDPGPDRQSVVGEPVTIIPLTTRRAIAVLAAPGDGPIVTELVRTIDATPAMAEQEMALIPLRTAQAAQVASALEQMLNVTDNDARTKLAASVAEQVRRLALRGEGIDDKDVKLDLTVPIRVQPEPQSNALIVTSTHANVAAVRELVGLLDRLPIGDAVLVRIFHLGNASADRVAGVVRELFRQGETLRRLPGTQLRGLPTTETGRALAGEIAVSIDQRTNAIVVAGREEAVALVEVLVKELDSSEGSNWVEPKLISLRFADATKLAALLDRILVQGMNDLPESERIKEQFGRLRMLRDRGADAAVKPGQPIEADLFQRVTRLRIVPEDQLNALIVVGSSANVQVVNELVKMLDVEEASRFDAVRVYPLRFAAADRIADTLRNLFRQQVSNQSIRKEDDVVVQSDPRSNALIIATSARSFAVVESLLKTLDAEGVHSTVGLHVLSVGRNDARTLAPKIERLMRERIAAMSRDVRSERDVVSIQADEATNTLIVACSDENIAIIKGMLDVLSTGDFNAGEQLEIFSLRSARAAEMVALLDDLYVKEEIRTRGQGALRLRADERLNAVIVNGTEADISRIRELVNKLDGATLSSVREIRILPLKASNALEMVNLLENVLSGRPVGGPRGSASRQATILRFVRDAAQRTLEERGATQITEADISAGIREQVSLTPDMRTNSVVVSAPASMMTMITALIADLEESASGARKIEVYTLTNADAEQTAELLRDLFNLRRQGNLFVLVPSGGTGTQPPAPNAPTTATDSLGLGDLTLTVVPDERQALAITVDPRTNSLLVSGTPEYLRLVSEVVNNLDNQVAEERRQVTYELKNARVEEVATALQTFMSQEQDRVSRTLGPDRAGSLIRRLEKEISVVGVPGSSRLILSASPRYMDKVLGLIQELDKPPAQVLIQVLLAEVTLDSESTWGVDFTLQPQGSLGLKGLLRAAGSGVTTAIGVPNLSVSTLDFDLLIRALEAQGRLEVLSRPQVLVNDNEQANIQVGETIQLVTNVERLNDGRTVSDVTPREVGVILNVTPSIAPDGFVRLDIAPEISAITARTTQISEDFSAPIISQRKADTTVTVRDGQTIVIGGLIQNQLETRKTKVPLLGDIPILGLPFRSEKTNTTKTELLIVLTPRVIVTDRDIREISVEEIDRLTLPERIKDAIKSNKVEGQTKLQGENNVGNEMRWLWPVDDYETEPKKKPVNDKTPPPATNTDTSADQP